MHAGSHFYYGVARQLAERIQCAGNGRRAAASAGSNGPTARMARNDLRSAAAQRRVERAGGEHARAHGVKRVSCSE